MSLTSYRFLFFTLAVLVLYYRISHQWILLLFYSILCILSYGIKPLCLIGMCTFSAYITAHTLYHSTKKQHWWLLLIWFCVNFGILFFCKFRLLTGVSLPLGISFYTFQAAGYLIDVHRDTVEPEKNPVRLLCFLCFFPQLIQGPVCRYSQSSALFSVHLFNWQNVSFGLQRTLWGCFKKLVVADRLAIAVQFLLGPGSGGVGFCLLSLLYAIQIYADFTGGIDIVLGISQSFGLQLPENFQHPFLSTSIADYWRRWHISLGQWMKDYIFYPVSIWRPLRILSKQIRKRYPRLGKRFPVYAATLITWLATGIWHGITPNFLLWGITNGVLILLSEEFKPLFCKIRERFSIKEGKKFRYSSILCTFLLMNFIRILDLFPNPAVYFSRLGSIFYNPALNELFCNSHFLLGLSTLDWMILFLGVTAMTAVSLLEVKWGSIRSFLWRKPPFLRRTLMFLLFLAVLLAGRYGIGYDPSNFIYNQF